jgi:SAM-dependent methyltransferase
MAPSIPSPADRVETVLRHLGLERAHVAACMSADWAGLVATRAGRIASLTVVAPHLNKGVPERAQAFEAPCLVVAGDQGAPAKRARDLAEKFGRGELATLRDYASPPWADTIADRTSEVAAALLAFLARAERERPCAAPVPSARDGEVAGIRYRIHGRGPALVLLPLSLAPSQWEPLLARLSDHYSVISLGGAHLGVISLLESRARSGYGDLVAQLLDRTSPAPDDAVLEVGCGTGALARGLAKRASVGSIVATDINPYLLSEARALAAGDGLSERLRFEAADAESLPYPDARFDLTFCCTVLEEGDADRMIAELVRVTRPGGRVAIMTRATDVDWWAHLPLTPELKRRIDALGPSTGAGAGDRGCADAGLYARATDAGIAPSWMGPQYAIYRDGDRLADVLDRLAAALPESDARVVRDALERARKGRTLFVAEPFHCVVGRKVP